MTDWPFFEPLEDEEHHIIWDPPPLLHFTEDLTLPPVMGETGMLRKSTSLIMTWVDRLAKRGERKEIDF